MKSFQKLEFKILFFTVLFFNIGMNAQNGINAKTFYQHDKYLSSDKMEGRFPGTKGNNDAADYIEKYFKKFGLKKFNDSYFQSFSLFVKEGLNKVKSDSVKTQNVVGYIEGSDEKLKNEFIVIGAHYDHWGWGGQNSGSKKKDVVAIHNGADDNASGVSALLCILEEVSKSKIKPKRSIIFVSFSGEEEGLLGSKYFVSHLPVEKSAVKVMLNMDMVGRLNAEKQIYMGGAGTFPEGVELMKKLGENSGLNPVVFAGDVGGSDHVSFYKASISAVGFHTGGHSQYHTPEDDIDLINIDGGALVSKYIYNALVSIADYEQPLYFINQD
ncbi:M20/M25/M40 family metallo-hydrolase [Flavobacterium sp. ANB]|uniref:M20/M25/M40 family metallo-hydrolase n=1 Tax=unclassified Flavobacterium TaxID=196869 RepID=UPI0012B92FB8|nr:MULTISPECIES: M20/M25/M40 family metallo-hydrolase [unclassified Flavobacterium]MBF4516095.1 M20/M25/M40 family metallo-hydrolase [Flavobacterium sp. ANB]MTD72192.1 M20/M25/M40 family metallo-hydrolase [Flavobacterium sp. LC2016-13]